MTHSERTPTLASIRCLLAFLAPCTAALAMQASDAPPKASKESGGATVDSIADGRRDCGFASYEIPEGFITPETQRAEAGDDPYETHFTDVAPFGLDEGEEPEVAFVLSHGFTVPSDNLEHLARQLYVPERGFDVVELNGRRTLQWSGVERGPGWVAVQTVTALRLCSATDESIALVLRTGVRRRVLLHRVWAVPSRLSCPMTWKSSRGYWPPRTD